MVAPLDDRDVDVRVTQPLRRGEAAEAAADDDDPAAPVRRSDGTGLLPGRGRGPNRSSRWSPTRSAFAIAVRAGFTAPMLGKKLVSTT
jgi:hypothetical protein